MLVLNFRLFSKIQLDYNLQHVLIKSVQLHYVFCLYPALRWFTSLMLPQFHSTSILKSIQLQKHLTKLTVVSFPCPHLSHCCFKSASNKICCSAADNSLCKQKPPTSFPPFRLSCQTPKPLRSKIYILHWMLHHTVCRCGTVEKAQFNLAAERNGRENKHALPLFHKVPGRHLTVYLRPPISYDYLCWKRCKMPPKPHLLCFFLNF